MPPEQLMIKRRGKREKKRECDDPMNNACTQWPNKNFMGSLIHQYLSDVFGEDTHQKHHI